MQVLSVVKAGVEASQLLLPLCLVSSVLLGFILDVCSNNAVDVHCWGLPDNCGAICHSQYVKQRQAGPVGGIAGQVGVDVVAVADREGVALERPVAVQHWGAAAVVGVCDLSVVARGGSPKGRNQSQQFGLQG